MKTCTDCGSKFKGGAAEELCPECFGEMIVSEQENSEFINQLKFENNILSKACEDQITRINELEHRIETASFKSKVLASHCGYHLGNHTEIQASYAFEKSQEIFEILSPEWRVSEENRITQELIDGKHHLIYGSDPKVVIE